MEKLNFILCEALIRYFTVLNKTGYKKQSDVNALILLSFLQHILEEYSDYISEYDYNVIDDIISCLYGKSCLVPYSEFLVAKDVTKGYVTKFSHLYTQYYVQNNEEIPKEEAIPEPCPDKVPDYLGNY